MTEEITTSVEIPSSLLKHNLETFSLVWLNAAVNETQENIDAQLELRSSINVWQIFQEKDECIQHILSIPKGDQVILIVSGKLGKIVVPKIHDLHQLWSIYIYCIDKERNREWSSDFTKVRSNFSTVQSFLRVQSYRT